MLQRRARLAVIGWPMTRSLIGWKVTSSVPCSGEFVAPGLTPEKSYNLFYELTCKSYIVYASEEIRLIQSRECVRNSERTSGWNKIWWKISRSREWRLKIFVLLFSVPSRCCQHVSIVMMTSWVTYLYTKGDDIIHTLGIIVHWLINLLICLKLFQQYVFHTRDIAWHKSCFSYSRCDKK